MGSLTAIGARGVGVERRRWVTTTPRAAASISEPAAASQRRGRAGGGGAGRAISAATKVSGDRAAKPASGLLLKGDGAPGRSEWTPCGSKGGTLSGPWYGTGPKRSFGGGCGDECIGDECIGDDAIAKGIGAAALGGARVAGRASCAVGGSTSSASIEGCAMCGGTAPVPITVEVRERGLTGGRAGPGLGGGREGCALRGGGGGVVAGRAIDIDIGGAESGSCDGREGARATGSSSYPGSGTARVASSSGGAEVAVTVGMSICVGSSSTATSSS
ncbi:MAG: hypothetical protein IPF99_23155 [Deltaproteobacteria bacterium]|nr:hypothetical protein [Deltaproteobacteria bacterium]